VTEQYTRAAPPLWNKGWGVKTLFRFDPVYWKLGIHRPSIRNKWLETDFPTACAGSTAPAVPMEDYFKFRGWRSIRRTLGYDWAQMNHYAVKSVDAYAVRQFRGNVNNKKDKYNAEYWALQDRNEVEDRAILRHAERRAAIMAELLADPVLGSSTKRAREGRGAPDEYKQDRGLRRLRDGLIDASPVPITEVEAKPPKARDPEKIAALMSRVERAAHDRDGSEQNGTAQAGWATAERRPLRGGRDRPVLGIAVDWIENHGILLPADPRVFAPEALNAVLSGRFERRHARNILGYLWRVRPLARCRLRHGLHPLRALTRRGDLGHWPMTGAQSSSLRAGRGQRAPGPVTGWRIADGSAAPALARCLAVSVPT
jgi:hypothetical protein